MLLNDTARLEKVQSKATPAQNPVPARLAHEATKVNAASDRPVVPFARLPHSILADARLSPTDRLIAASLLFWACDRSTATMSNNSIGKLLGLSLSVIARGMRALKRLGYIQADVTRPTPANITGRVVRLVWVENPAILPAAPNRRAIEASGPVAPSQATRGAVAGDAPTTEQTPSLEQAPPVRGDKGGQSDPTTSPLSRGTGNGELRFVENSKILEKAQAEGDLERQRPQATSEVSAQVEPARPIEPQPLSLPELAPLSMASSPTSEPSRSDPGDGLTPGQRIALATMTPAERAAFEAKSPGMRQQILAAFKVAFEPVIFERLTRSQLKIPKFAATSPPDRSTAGLLRAVAGGDPRLVAELAESLCRDLGGAGDRRRWGALHKLAGQVLRREVEVDAVLDALRQAKGPKSVNPGAVFTTALRRFGWRPDSKHVLC